MVLCMDVLVLGGTSFLGRAIVTDLIGHGHTPTLFTRGKTGTELFPGVERLVGDRATGDYVALQGRQWDTVVDVTAYVPRHVNEAIAALSDHAGRYVFISTGLVYDAAAAQDPITETSMRLAPYRNSEQIDDDSYGPLKVACEDDLLAHFGPRATIVRPGFIVGPHDPSDRFTYWVRRAARGGRMAVPDRLDRPIQVVDVRDVARLVLRLVEDDRPGAYNAVGPWPAVTLGELITTCGAVEFVPVPEGDLDFPLLLPDPTWDVMFHISAAAAHAAGMPRTPLSRTVADTFAWDQERGRPPLAAGLSDADESVLLK
jgi:2'-hydroxyisoflavone reductase